MIERPRVEREHHASTHPTAPPPPTLQQQSHQVGSCHPHTARRFHQPCDLPTAYITPRASTGECVLPPRRAKQDLPKPHPPPLDSARTARVLRVTAAPASSCVGSRRTRCSTEGGVQVKVEVVVLSTAHAERTHSSLLAVGRCLVGCVHSVTGCTADSSRAESGAWWWH
jgi:hypothetical protein